MPVLTSEQQEKKPKQRKIRNSEYYGMQGIFDGLYADSIKGKVFSHLMEIIESEENIKLAYRTVKKNTGSDTAGMDMRKRKRSLRKSSSSRQQSCSSCRDRPVTRRIYTRESTLCGSC